MKMSDSAMLEYVGGEVIVSGLKARPDLNGLTARVDEWLTDRSRFRCVVYDKDWLEGESVNLKPECCDRPTCERTGEELPCGPALADLLQAMRQTAILQQGVQQCTGLVRRERRATGEGGEAPR